MSCDLCSFNIVEADATAETPCCDRIVHTHCLISTIASNTINYHDSICVCGGILHALSHNNGIDYEAEQAVNKIRVEEIVKQPVAKKELSILKRSHREQNAALRAFTVKLNEVCRTYKEQISVSVNMIKTIKSDTLALLKNSDEFKKLRKLNSRTSFYLTRFKQKYNLNDRDINAFFSRVIRGRRRRYWRSHPAYLMTYKFRVRI